LQLLVAVLGAALVDAADRLQADRVRLLAVEHAFLQVLRDMVAPMDDLASDLEDPSVLSHGLLLLTFVAPAFSPGPPPMVLCSRPGDSSAALLARAPVLHQEVDAQVFLVAEA